MKILCVIPHYFCPDENAGAGVNNSSDISRKSERITALSEAVCSIHQLYGDRSAGLDHWRKVSWQAASPTPCEIDVNILTIGDNHLLKGLPISPALYRQAELRAEISPTYLGFAAHIVMREQAGKYDWYCYIEDDVIMTDPLFFKKRALFDARFGPEALLQPNRFEVSSYRGYKVYPDYILASSVTASYQNLSIQPELSMNFLGEDIRFERTSYPSAGSFFLNAAQLESWITHPSFQDVDVSFMSALDSASILSVMKTFRIYKAVLDQASFLEVRHGSPRWANMVGTPDTPLMPRDTPFQGLPDHAEPGDDLGKGERAI